jgi:hypothetical protein
MTHKDATNVDTMSYVEEEYEISSPFSPIEPNPTLHEKEKGLVFNFA